MLVGLALVCVPAGAANANHGGKPPPRSSGKPHVRTGRAPAPSQGKVIFPRFRSRSLLRRTSAPTYDSFHQQGEVRIGIRDGVHHLIDAAGHPKTAGYPFMTAAGDHLAIAWKEMGGAKVVLDARTGKQVGPDYPSVVHELVARALIATTQGGGKMLLDLRSAQPMTKSYPAMVVRGERIVALPDASLVPTPGGRKGSADRKGAALDRVTGMEIATVELEPLSDVIERGPSREQSIEAVRSFMLNRVGALNPRLTDIDVRVEKSSGTSHTVRFWTEKLTGTLEVRPSPVSLYAGTWDISGRGKVLDIDRGEVLTDSW